MTIRDVSRIAGVSIKTVSRVINNEKYVSAPTRARVEQVMADLAFQPSFAARALAGRRSHQIAIVCDNPSAWYVYEIQHGTRLRCQRDGVRMIAQPYDRGSPSLVQDIVSLVDQVHPDGIVLTPPVCDNLEVLSELKRRAIPFVRVQPGTHLLLSSSTFINNERAAYEMTSHLLGLGHTRIGFIVGDRTYAVSEDRLRGFERALRDAHMLADPALLREGHFDFCSGSAATEWFLALRNPPTAIFASNDEMAAGALAAAHRLGVEVPAQLSVAGFDDTSFASIVWPALTTVRQPVRALAEAAADLLLVPPENFEDRQIGYELILRESTGAVPKGV